MEDAVLSRQIAEVYARAHPDTVLRTEYFRELLRLQAELIRLQDWVVHHREKVVITEAPGARGRVRAATVIALLRQAGTCAFSPRESPP